MGSRGKRASSFQTALRLVESGHVDLEPVIGARLPLDDWEKGIELVVAGRQGRAGGPARTDPAVPGSHFSAMR